MDRTRNDAINSSCSYKGCKEKPLALSDHCWDHLPDMDSYLSKLIKFINSGNRLNSANLKKVVLKNSRLEKAHLKQADLSQTDFSGTHFFDSNFDSADMIGSNLSGCDLTHCSLKGSDMTKARLNHARLWNTALSNANLTEADLTCADLWCANLFNVKLWNTQLSGAKSISRNSFSKTAAFFDDPSINESGHLSAEHAYRDLKQYFISNGMYNDASWASFKEKSMERHVLKKRRDWNYLPSLLMNILCGYGEKPYRIVLTAMFTIILFAALFMSFNAVESAASPSYQMRWYDYIYYSTITFTTVGYGDFVPKPFGFFRMLAAFEAFCGVFVTGLFIFTLARKYSAR